MVGPAFLYDSLLYFLFWLAIALKHVRLFQPIAYRFLRFIPIAAVLSPASLTTTIAVLTNSTSCMAANLNFTEESYNNFRHPKNISGFYGISLSYYNTTDVNATTPGWFDYWDQPSKNALRLSVMSVYSNKPVERDDAATSACGAGWNCSYSISFTGPGYQCSEIASGVGANDSVLQLIGAPFNTSSLVPAGINIYQAVVDNGDYTDPQLPLDSKGQPIEGPPWPEDLGAFKTEPKLWIGYTVDSSQPLPSDSPFASRWKTIKTPKIFTCDHYETQYSVQFNYSEGRQSATVTNRTFLNPIIGTTLAQFPNGTLDPSKIEPASNYILPTGDVPHYKLTAAYHALGHLFRAWLRGTIELEQSWPLTRSDVSETRLVDQRIYWPIPNLQDQLQSLYEDLLFTLLSDTHLVIGMNTSVPCTKSRQVNLFEYHARALWLGYAIVILVALIFVGIGFAAMLENGVVSGTSFSRILVTTRNPALDQLSVGACLGSDPFPTELMRTKFRFGVLDDADADNSLHRDVALLGERPAHCAFGTEAQTSRIVKGTTYAGLRGVGPKKKKVD
jgi:hypothetical protein